MYTLFISTIDKFINIGLLKDNEILAHEIKESINSHSVYTIPLIDKILKKYNLTPQDLDTIEVVNGPGSFTGVRIGVTIAKTLAYTLNIPIKTISSIQSLALSAESKKKIITLKDIKGVYYGLFDSNNELLEPLAYLSKKDFNEYIENNNYQNILIEDQPKLDLKKIHEFLNTQEPINPHLVKPLYIKQIEVEK